MQTSDYPPIFQSANKVASAQQGRHFFCLRMSLVVLIAGALFSLKSDAGHVGAAIAATFLAIAIGLTLLMAFHKFDKAWYIARSFAESVKTLTWRYVMHAGKYLTDDTDARREFRKDLVKTVDNNSEALKIIPATVADTGEITQGMVNLRSMSLTERVAYYKTNRIDDQRKWYIAKAESNRRWNNVFFALMILFQITALICVVAKLMAPDSKYLPTGLFTTLAGAAVSWMQARRFSELSISYNAVAHQLSIICSDYGQITDEKEFSQFVSDIEDTFSNESGQWSVRRGV